MDVISAGPTGRSLRTLNNKNNLAGLYLKKRLDQYTRERSFIISHIDRDRFDTKDFLSQIQRIDSDNNEAAVQYLGRTRKTKVHNRRLPKATSLHSPQTSYFPSTVPPLTSPATHDPSFITDDDARSPSLFPKPTSTTPNLKQCRTMPDIFEERSTPQRMRRSSTSPRIFVTAPIQEEGQDSSELELSHSRSSFPSLRKNSLYLQIASAKQDPEFSESSDEEEVETLDGQKRSRSKISTRRKSFMAWVNEKRKSEGGLLPGYIKDKNKQETTKDKRRNSFMRWLSSRGVNLSRENSLEEISEDREFVAKNAHGVAALTSRTAEESPFRQSRHFGKTSFRQAGEMMRNIVYMKSYKRLPLDVRLKKFYEKIDKSKTKVEKLQI